MDDGLVLVDGQGFLQRLDRQIQAADPLVTPAQGQQGVRVIRVQFRGIAQGRNRVVVPVHGPICQSLQVSHVGSVPFRLVQLLQGIQGALRHPIPRGGGQFQAGGARHQQFQVALGLADDSSLNEPPIRGNGHRYISISKTADMLNHGTGGPNDPAAPVRLLLF
jgi:hypothetical protein